MLALSFFYFAIVFFLVVVGEYVAGTLHVHYGVSVVLLLFLCVGGWRFYTLFCTWPDSPVSCLSIVSFLIYVLMAKNLKGDERFVTTDRSVYQLLQLEIFPNFSASGNIETMRSMYYGKDAFLVQAGDYIYHVDEDTFQAVKDANYLKDQPKELVTMVKNWTSAQVDSYRRNITAPRVAEIHNARIAFENELWARHGVQPCSVEQLQALADRGDNSARAVLADAESAKRRMCADLQDASLHQSVMELAVHRELAQAFNEKALAVIDRAVVFGVHEPDGCWSIACSIDGSQQPEVKLTPDETARLKAASVRDRQQMLHRLASIHYADKIYQLLPPSLRGEHASVQQAPTSDILSDEHIRLTADKVSAVLEKFYSLHEADQLTRIITDPDKSVDDVLACMHVIDRRIPLAEEQQSRITAASFVFPDDVHVGVKADIDGVSLPARMLSEADARDIRSMDMLLLTPAEVRDMASDLALTYYSAELSMPSDELRSAAASSLTQADARMFSDLEWALVQRYPGGVSLPVEDLTATDIFSYIQYGRFRDDGFSLAGLGEQPQREDCLQAELRIPSDQVFRLTASVTHYCDESYEDFISGLDNADVFDAPTTQLMHEHPDLQGAHLVMPEYSMPSFMHVEGSHLDKAVAWLLQNPQLDTAQLRTFLRDPVAAQQALDDARSAVLTDYDRERIARMDLPEGMDMVRNSEKMYFFERGTLGYAVVDRMRGVTYSGDTLSRSAQDFVNDLALHKNLHVLPKDHTFFLTPGADAEQRAYLDTMKNTLVMVDIQQDLYGRQLHTVHTRVLTEGDMQHFQDITGRITDARIVGIDKPMVRCKVDGVQQMGQPLTKAERIRAGHYGVNDPLMQRFAQSVAVSHFATMLYDSPAQERSQGRGR